MYVIIIMLVQALVSNVLRFEVFASLVPIGYCHDHEGNIYNAPVRQVKVFIILLNCSNQTK